MGRPESNTPQQALVLLNDPSFLEAAKAFAARIMVDGGRDAEERIGYAIMLALSREVRPSEMSVFLALYERHLAEFGADLSSAHQLISVGLWDAPEALDVAELAAWTSVARAILNMHETITRY